MMVNRIEKLLVECKDFKTPEECFKFLDSQKLSNSELRQVIDTKYFRDTSSLCKAYQHYGNRLIDPAYAADVQEAIHAGSKSPMHSSARILG